LRAFHKNISMKKFRRKINITNFEEFINSKQRLHEQSGRKGKWIHRNKGSTGDTNTISVLQGFLLGVGVSVVSWLIQQSYGKKR